MLTDGFIQSSGLIFSLNFVGYLITVLTGTHKITDLIGVGSFVAVTYMYTFGSGSAHNLVDINPRAAVGNALVGIWGLRLATFLFARCLRLGEDKRLRKFFRDEGEPLFDRTRSFFPVRLLAFWTIQSIWAIFCTIPLVLINLLPPVEMTCSCWVCAALALLGAYIEGLADHEKNVFKNKNPETFCNVGLYKYTRHPNYMGELIFWWSFFILSLPVLLPDATLVVAAALSPLTITFLLLKVSGLPLLERKADAAYKDNKGYKAYKQNTAVLIPYVY
jgi:steroid 5-alpha reductase family enzyme